MPSCLKTVLIMLSLIFAPLLAHASPVTFETEDGVKINADIAFPETVSEPVPAVIFIHQGGSDKSEWTQTDLYAQIVQQGMVALAYDVRGHGQSEGRGGRSLFDDPARAPKDLQAALQFLAGQEHVDASRIAIVGSSIGANLALVGLSKPELEVKTAIAISGKTSAWINLAGGAEAATTPSSVYLIAAEHEQDGLRAIWAQEIYDASADPRQVDIIPGAHQHGTGIIANRPDLQQRILNWLATHL